MNFNIKKVLPIVLLVVTVFSVISKILNYFKEVSKPTEKVDEVNNLPHDNSYYVQVAKNLRASLIGAGTDADALKEIFSSINEKELKRVHNLYIDLYDIMLSVHLRSELDNWFIFGNSELIKQIKKLYVKADIAY